MSRQVNLEEAACRDCGCVQDHFIAVLEEQVELQAQLEQAQEDLANAERELRGKRSMISRLQNDQDTRPKSDPKYQDAQNVLAYWRSRVMPRARELGGKRLKNVLARLNGGYSVDELKRAVDGYGRYPYVVDGKRRSNGRRDDWYADIELICRNPQKVDMGLRLYARAIEEAKQAQMRPREPEVAAAEPGELSALGRQALHLVEAGYHVFPVRAREKVPATRHGLKDAKCDPDAVRACWSKHPDLNVGIRCGVESGIVVLDVDGDLGHEALRELEARHGDLPTTASVVTPSGGAHYYFRHPGGKIGNTAGYPAPGLDIRGDGGYVLSVGSIHPNGGTYEQDEEAELAPMPGWLLRLLREREHELGKAKSDDEWGRILASAVGAGQRNDVMTRCVGWLFSRGHEAASVYSIAKALNTANMKPPMADREVESIVRSIAGREIRKGT